MYKFQLVTRGFHGELRANGSAEWRGHNGWHVGVYVLGSRVSLHKERLYHTPEYLPRRSRRRCEDLQYPGPDAPITTTVNASGSYATMNRQVVPNGPTISSTLLKISLRRDVPLSQRCRMTSQPA